MGDDLKGNQESAVPLRESLDADRESLQSAHMLRPELEPLPERMKDLPVDARGYAVPWFVAWIDGPDGKVPEFRAMDGQKLTRAIRERLCWVCGQRLGSWLCFVIGPMCAINRISSEPPSHLECAQWSARNCPFLSKPQMIRRETGPGAEPARIESARANVAGVMIERNPGVALLWICRDYKLVPDGKGGRLFSVGDPDRVEWWALGRPATRAEVEHSVATGLPALIEVARTERGGLEELARRQVEVEALYPTERTADTALSPATMGAGEQAESLQVNPKKDSV